MSFTTIKCHRSYSMMQNSKENINNNNKKKELIYQIFIEHTQTHTHRCKRAEKKR